MTTYHRVIYYGLLKTSTKNGFVWHVTTSGNSEKSIGAIMNKKKKKKDDIVQLQNPRSKKYVRINRTTGQVYSPKITNGPYRKIPVINIKGRKVLWEKPRLLSK